jgi:hypothetical protein
MNYSVGGLNPFAVEAMRIMVPLMLENGITAEQVETMIKTNPIKLIY